MLVVRIYSYETLLFAKFVGVHATRSGKVTGRGFDVRNIEHWKCALAYYATASFYLRYPAKASVRAS